MSVENNEMRVEYPSFKTFERANFNKYEGMIGGQISMSQFLLRDVFSRVNQRLLAEWIAGLDQTQVDSAFQDASKVYEDLINGTEKDFADYQTRLVIDMALMLGEKRDELFPAIGEEQRLLVEQAYRRRGPVWPAEQPKS